MEGQIFTAQGSEMLNEIVVIFWASVIATFLTLVIEWICNVRENREELPRGSGNTQKDR